MDPTTKELIDRLKAGLQVTKVIATRSVKGQRGDSFAGFAAAWKTVQEDGTQDMDPTAGEVIPLQCLTLKEAKIAGYLLAMQADISAYEHAWAGGSITKSAMDDAIRTVRTNYLYLVQRATAPAIAAPVPQESQPQ